MFFVPAFLPFYLIYRWEWGNVAKKMKFFKKRISATRDNLSFCTLPLTRLD